MIRLFIKKNVYDSMFGVASIGLSEVPYVTFCLFA